MVEVCLNNVSLFLQSRHPLTGVLQLESQILHTVSATIQPGQVFALMGGSGCGKVNLSLFRGILESHHFVCLWVF